MDQDQLIRDIEKLFAEATPANLRYASRDLEKLVRQVADPDVRKRYEAAIDVLPDMVDHHSEA
jgi:hypothetical protein